MVKRCIIIEMWLYGNMVKRCDLENVSIEEAQIAMILKFGEGFLDKGLKEDNTPQS